MLWKPESPIYRALLKNKCEIAAFEISSGNGYSTMSFILKTWEPLGIIFEPWGSVIDFCICVSTLDYFPIFSNSR
jgi:hypothetical protein